MDPGSYSIGNGPGNMGRVCAIPWQVNMVISGFGVDISLDESVYQIESRSNTLSELGDETRLE